MPNHLEISSKVQSRTQNMQNSTKSRKSDMSGPAKTCPGGQVLTANQRKCFYFFQILHLSICLLTNLSVFMNHVFYYANSLFLIKSSVLLNKFISFYKIKCFNKQIYDFKIHRKDNIWKIFRTYKYEIYKEYIRNIHKYL